MHTSRAPQARRSIRMDAGLDTKTREKLEDLVTQFSQSRAAVLRQVMRWGLRRKPPGVSVDTAPRPVQHLFFIVDAVLHQQVKDTAKGAGIDVAPWLRHLMRQVTKADFPKNWQAMTTERLRLTAPRSHDFRQYWKRFMLRLDDQASARLEELASHFGVPHAEVIRQLITQAQLDDSTPSWHVVVPEGQQEGNG